MLSTGAKPWSTEKGAQGLSSSFSAMQQVYFAGVPWVAWSSWCGRSPKVLIAVSRRARPIVALARNPEPKTFPRLLIPSRSRIGPLTTSIGAVPVVLCQMPFPAYPSSVSASHAASTTGKYSGRHPAIAALIAAERTVHERFRWSIRKTTSSGARSVRARNSAR